MFAHVFSDLRGEAGARVVHREQDRGHHEIGVEVFADEVDVLPQHRNAFERVVLGLNRHEYLAGGHERIDGEQAERGRAIDKHVIQARQPPLFTLGEVVGKRIFEARFARDHGDEFDLGPRKVNCRGRAQQ